MANKRFGPQTPDGPKRFKPPNLTLVTEQPHLAGVELETESPLSLSDSEDGDSQYDSSEESPSALERPPFLKVLDNDHEAESPADIQAELAKLEELRRSVQKNLRLRPIRSSSNLRKSSENTNDSASNTSGSPSSVDSAISPASSISSYYTPLNEHPPITSPKSARWIGPAKLLSAPPPPKRPSRSVDPGTLYIRLTQYVKRPLLIDTRPAAAHLQYHIRDSVNIAIPSLILKRCRKPGNSGFNELDSLRQFITTDEGKSLWDKQMHPGGPWDGDVILYDEEMDPRDQSSTTVVPWVLVSVLSSLVSEGNVDWLEDGLGRAGHHPDLQRLVVSGAESSFTNNVSVANPGSGLTKLNTSGRKPEKLSVKTDSDAAPQPAKAPPSPLPLMPGSLRLNGAAHALMDATPSPPPSQVSFRRPPPPKRPSVPNLRKLDTSSSERLPKLSLNTRPVKSATLSVPPLSLNINPPSSPSHLSLSHSNFSGRSPVSPSFGRNGDDAYFAPPRSPRTPMPETPRTARPDDMSPVSAYPSAYPASPYQSHFGAPQTAFHTSFSSEDSPSSAEDSHPQFSVSTILPNFLYLGPEMTTEEHVEELKGLGVQRIVNLAMECDKNDYGLRLGEVFDRYYKIAMRDIVEEDGIKNGVKEVCGILDDARLHSSPTYVHCKAGKSRSVTAVMAYLIHANHWTLSKAYAFVTERRKGISPNIGFVSELMTFEEEELGGKSSGVNSGANAAGRANGEDVAAASLRRAGTARERDTSSGAAFAAMPSMPMHGQSHSISFAGTMSFAEAVEGERGAPGPLSAGALALVGDSGQETEVKDASGRYRHARRAPVDETTLQPSRRVSKAGLESSAYNQATFSDGSYA